MIFAPLRKILPILDWLPQYKLENLRGDVIAGITLAFFVIPISMAYASLAGLPPQTGIYCCLFSGLLYLFFGTSRQLVIGPTSSISIIVGISIGTMTGGDPAKAVVFAASTTLVTAALFFIAYVIRLSTLVNFISDTILTGFKAGAALVIASTQFPRLFGISIHTGSFFENMGSLFSRIGETNPAVLIFGVAALALLITGNYFFKGKPVSLVIVIISILLLTFTGLKDFGIGVAGKIPEGLPQFRVYLPDFNELSEVMFLAMACFFLSYVESISAARTLARKNGYEVDPRQELVALGFANLASSVGSGYAVGGGLSQATVNDRSGAKSLLSTVFTAAVLIFILLFFTSLFKDMPQVILAVIVLDAITGLIKIQEMKHLFKVSRTEFWVSMLTIVAVVFLGVLKGLLLAAIFSIVSLLKTISTPHIAILGKIPGTDLFSDIARHPDNEPVDGALILRPEASILYFNITFLREKILQLLNHQEGEIKLLILDLSSANYVDVSGATFLIHLEDYLEKRNIKFRIVDALGRVRDILRAEGMEQEIGHISRRVTIQDILDETFHSSQPLPNPPLQGRELVDT